VHQAFFQIERANVQIELGVSEGLIDVEKLNAFIFVV
tara:strand:+ start:276 stop:386 length:111 start_codon:yes stop_codon:yes gene_type:complete